MEEFEVIIPSDSEIKLAQEKLKFIFSPEYIAFIKSGYDLGEAALEALEISNPPSYANIYEVRSDAKKYYDLPDELLPICEDNSDYYCLNTDGEVVFCSHNGATNERWENVAVWQAEMISEADE
ncbi:SMI1/KNR4 family protein [Thalassotalea nanhaiensis]|uniref:SMI1/KNR4 family protein n=1 Tax=Thalassotalea nanhaiensis TaxID=3065648 RepID=A0ABY9TJL1_9GAMM|nr:SMI1/KNR4 family protein [Colwelliaceae bacterium SQ345]